MMKPISKDLKRYHFTKQVRM